MNRHLIVVITAALTLAACGGGSPEGSTSGEAKVELSAIDQLKALSTDLQAGVEALMQPINDADSLINDITSLPSRLNLNASAVMAMAKATVETGTVTISADLNLDATVRTEVEAIFAKLQGIVEGLKSTPDRVQALTAKAAAAVAEVPLLATRVTTEAQATIANPFASAEGKLAAEADLAAVTQIQADVNAQIQDVQNKIAGIPALAATALAKLTAAFAS